jgi:BRCT domain type II-containing protein
MVVSILQELRPRDLDFQQHVCDLNWNPLHPAPNRFDKETTAGSNESDPVGSEKKKQIDTNHTQEGIRHGRKPARQEGRGIRNLQSQTKTRAERGGICRIATSSSLSASEVAAV